MGLYSFKQGVIQRRREQRLLRKVVVVVSRSVLWCRLQSLAENVQVWLSADLKRLYGANLWRMVASTFGKGNSRDMTNACAGALVGIGEVFLLPLDVLKIKS